VAAQIELVLPEFKVSEGHFYKICLVSHFKLELAMLWEVNIKLYINVVSRLRGTAYWSLKKTPDLLRDTLNEKATDRLSTLTTEAHNTKDICRTSIVKSLDINTTCESKVRSKVRLCYWIAAVIPCHNWFRLPVPNRLPLI
jgi:hypothetical protein